MSWFSRRFGKRGEQPEPDVGTLQEVSEMLDQYHPRASITDGDQIMLNLGQVLANITEAMERLDLDINTPVSIEEDVASFDELATMVQRLGFGPMLAVHVVNTAMRIMTARYPTELVRRPFPPKFDLRIVQPVKLSDTEHGIAKGIFNRRTTNTGDLTEEDVPEVETLDAGGQLQVFVALFMMYGTKVGALKHRTGIE